MSSMRSNYRESTVSSKEGKRVRIETMEPINNPITVEDAKALISPSRAALQTPQQNLMRKYRFAITRSRNAKIVAKKDGLREVTA